MMQLVRHALFGSGLLVSVGHAWANGINPPAPTTRIVEVSCKQAHGKPELLLKRATLVPELLQIQVSDDAPLKMRLVDLRRVTLAAAAAPDHQGWVRAIVEAPSLIGTTPARVAVRRNGVPVKLNGFNEDKARVSVNLMSCIELKITGPAELVNDPRTPAKA
ncbi:hypothetical protein [Pelomonas sp. KK5]|uniref:hypothetical protein n=1 Tax=Pelomonas sp. KK5 TaxID=1855730 RepID=UPI00097BF3FA|nr:hypothetical protein [Pelomonas sp. KK5]